MSKRDIITVMIVIFSLQTFLFVLLLLLLGVGITAVFLDRYQMGQKLLPPVGTDPTTAFTFFGQQSLC